MQTKTTVSSSSPQLSSRKQKLAKVGEDRGGGKKPLELLVACKLVQLLWKSVWRFLRKLNLELPYLREYESAYNRDSCTSMFIRALLTRAKLWNQPRCLSTNEWIKKHVMYTQWSIIQL
jgi:hypothetical protein